MSDLQDRDLSDIPDHKLSASERKELERRFFDFLKAVRGSIVGRKAAPKAKKPVEKWNPALHGKKH